MSARKNEAREEYLIRRREYRQRPEVKERSRERSRLYRLQHPDKIKEYNRINYSKSPGSRGKLKRTYGITPEQYDELLMQQNGVCAACGGSQTRIGRPLCVDHNHKIKVVRGLVCDACNICAGYIESSRFEKVMAYLFRSAPAGQSGETKQTSSQSEWDRMWEPNYWDQEQHRERR